MSLHRCTEAIVRSARTVELSRLAKKQSEEAIFASLKMLRAPVYPDSRLEPTEP